MKKKKDTWNIAKTEFCKNDKVRVLSDQDLSVMHRIELEMLKDFIDVVERNHIRYTLSGGSVLGAIRHQGFIPWDDDIDINMPRADFDRFVKVFDRELGDRYELYTPEGGQQHGMAGAQIKKKGTVYQSFNELSKSQQGIPMDIFVIENTPDSKLLRKLHGFLCLAAGYMLTCRKTCNDMPYLAEYIGDNQVLQKAFSKKAGIGRLFSWMSLDTASRLTASVYALCKNNHSRLVCIPSGRKHYFGEMLPREDFCDSIPAVFEGLEVRIPKGFKKYMNLLYGSDYMALPPMEKRERHPVMQIDFGQDAKKE